MLKKSVFVFVPLLPFTQAQLKSAGLLHPDEILPFASFKLELWKMKRDFINSFSCFDFRSKNLRTNVKVRTFHCVAVFTGKSNEL